MERRIFILAGALPLVAAFGAIIVGLGLVVFGDNGSDTTVAQGSTVSPTASAKATRTPAPTSAEQTGNGWLGVSAQTADGGVEVTDVISGGPADDAGIKKGDVITNIDGETMESFEALSSLIRTHSPGDKVAVTIKRDGDTKDVDVTLGSHPARAALPDIGGLLPDLSGILDGFSLDRLIGGQLQYLDTDGNVVTLTADAGDITAISSDKITIHPPKGDDKTFDLTSDAHVPDNLANGDQVIVISKDSDVVAVISTDISKLLPGGGDFPHFGPNGSFNPRDLFPNGILPHCTFDEHGVNCDFNASPTPTPQPQTDS
jgi:membrane-associated protease RseP (regulator of RpoE activity)